MGTDETVIRQFVDAVGSGNGEAAAALTAADAVIELPGGTTLSGPDGARHSLRSMASSPTAQPLSRRSRRWIRWTAAVTSRLSDDDP
jgi:SnoaL-like protein